MPILVRHVIIQLRENLWIFLTFTKIVGIINPIRAIVRKFIAIFLTFATIVGIIKG